MDGWTHLHTIETGGIWVVLKKVGPTFFKFTASRLVVFAQNHLVYDVTIILSVKEFHLTIF